MKMYEISEKDIAKLEDVVSYFRYHNKNLTNPQFYCIDQLAEVVDRLYDRYCGHENDPYEEVSYESLCNIIKNRLPLGKFVAFDDKVGIFVAVDNYNGDAFTECFKTKNDAIDWLSDY